MGRAPVRDADLQARAVERGLPVLQPTRLKEPEFLQQFDALQASSEDYAPVEGVGEAAFASEDEETAFVRIMLLPREWEGRRTIRYVDAADEDKPRLQRATVFFD